MCCDFKMKNWGRGSIFTDFAISEIFNVKNRQLASAKQQTVNVNSFFLLSENNTYILLAWRSI